MSTAKQGQCTICANEHMNITPSEILATINLGIEIICNECREQGEYWREVVREYLAENAEDDDLDRLGTGGSISF